MNRTVAFLLSVLPLVTPNPAWAKDKPSAADEIKIVQGEPEGCEFLEDISAEKNRIFFTVSNKKLYDKALARIKKQTLKIGGDTAWIVSHDTTTINTSINAKAYNCRGANSGVKNPKMDSVAAVPAKKISLPSKPAAQQSDIRTSQELAPAQRSKDLRVGKQWMLVGELGFALPYAPTAGFSAGYFIDPDTIIDGNIVSGSEKSSEFALTVMESHASYAGARLKKFWGNSFYTNSGIGLRSMSRKITFPAGRYTGIDKESTYEASNTSLVVDFAIGNNWQMNTFTIGVDWIGLFVPLATLTKDEKYSDPNLESQNNSDIASFKKDSKSTNGQALRLYMGVSL